jgi:DNA-binding CsgD family transcriptional regulator
VRVGGLLERDGVIPSVDELLGELAAGHSAALYVLGEAGLGKTSVLDHACGRSRAAGLAVGLARGHPMETGLPFGLLTQALDGIGGRGLLGEDGPVTVHDRSARFYGVLRWLEEHAGSGIVLAFDDMHWADADSLALISFISRRTDSLPLGVIACMRPWPSDATQVVASLAEEGRGVVRSLTPLSEAAAGSLLESRLGRSMPSAVLKRAFTLCAGNPLLLGQVAVALCAGNPLLLGQVAVALGNREDLPSAAGPGRRAFEHGVLLARFAGLPAEGMRCAQAASVLGTTFLPEVAAQVAGLDGPEIDVAIEALGQAGLIDQSSGAEADFVHPLFRQAPYDDLAGPVRTRLHARAFGVLHGRAMDAQAAEHAVLARMVGDPLAVSVLEQAGRAARRTGALAAAVTRLDEAVTMAGDRAAAGLLLAQAEALLTAGHADRAVSSYRALLGREDVAGASRVEAMWMLGRALVMAGDLGLAATTFSAAADLAAADDPATAAQVLLDASFSCWLTAGPAVALPFAARARELGSPLGGDMATMADGGWALVCVIAGKAAAMAAAEPSAPWVWRPELASEAGIGPDAGGGWVPVNSFAYGACLLERFEEADRAFSEVRAACQRSDRPEGLATLAIGHAYLLCRMGRLPEARNAIAVALPLVEIVPLMESFASVGMAYIELYAGHLEQSASWCTRAEGTAGPRGEQLALLHLWDLLGHRRLREGAAGEACDYYARLESAVMAMGIGEPCLPAWGRHAIAAYIAAGRATDAERVIAWLDRAASGLPCRYPRIASAVGRAQLAELAGDQARAAEHYLTALALHDQAAMPTERAETLLGYGGFLRRSGRAAASRSVLAEAIEVAVSAGADWLAGLAREELKVAGGRPGRRAAIRQLTAQERRVARLAATGATNAEIGSQLYLSVSTIETHLEHIYAKLGIHSRYELIAKAADGSWDS